MGCFWIIPAVSAFRTGPVENRPNTCIVQYTRKIEQNIQKSFAACGSPQTQPGELTTLPQTCSGRASRIG